MINLFREGEQVMNKKVIFIMSVLVGIFTGNVMASGDVDIYLRCNSPSEAIKLILGNADYGGSPGRYDVKPNILFGIYDGSYVDVKYRDVIPYVLREDVFKSNSNYYRYGMSGSGSDGWWIFEDSDSADYPPRQYHQYASTTSSKNSAIVGTSYGQIKVTYKRFDGTTGEKIINVQVQKRECEAYNNGKWREVSPGRWEQR
jgi:hypothetical protein